MTFEELELLAFNNSYLPQYINQYEQYTYLSLRCLYNDFRKRNIDKDQAQEEKRLIKQAYERSKQDHEEEMSMLKRVDNMRVNLAGLTKEAEQSDCPICKRIIRVFDGR